MLMQMAGPPSFSWLNHIPWCIYITSSLSIHPLIDTYLFPRLSSSIFLMHANLGWTQLSAGIHVAEDRWGKSPNRADCYHCKFTNPNLKWALKPTQQSYGVSPTISHSFTLQNYSFRTLPFPSNFQTLLPLRPPSLLAVFLNHVILEVIMLFEVMFKSQQVIPE